MLWWSGSFDRVNVIMLTVCGVAVGYAWYRAMRWHFRRRGMLPRDEPPRKGGERHAGNKTVQRIILIGWMVFGWIVLIAACGPGNAVRASNASSPLIAPGRISRPVRDPVRHGRLAGDHAGTSFLCEACPLGFALALNEDRVGSSA